MNSTGFANVAAIALYLVATTYLLIHIKQQRPFSTKVVAGIGSLALLAHAIGAYGVIVADAGVRFGILVIPTVFCWVINLLVIVSGLRKPLYNLLVFLFPLAIAAILSSQFADSAVIQIDRGLAGHIILSLVAYGLLTIATLQAILLSYLNRQLKHKHATGLVRILPPLETMDSLMFELIWAGQVVLTLSIITGVVFVADLAILFTSHHAVISVIAWLIYAILLWGRHQLGWRGKTAVRWAMGGFTALLLAYFGTKFAFEVVFHKPQLMENANVQVIEE